MNRSRFRSPFILSVEGEAEVGAGEPAETPAGGADEKPEAPAEEKPALSDEDKDSIIKSLREENAARRVKERELEERLQNSKSLEEFEALQKELAAERINRLRNDAVREHNVPEHLVDFITGEDEETIAEQAKKLGLKVEAEAPKPPSTADREPSGGAKPGQAPDLSLEEIEAQVVAARTSRRS